MFKHVPKETWEAPIAGPAGPWYTTGERATDDQPTVDVGGQVPVSSAEEESGESSSCSTGSCGSEGFILLAAIWTVLLAP